MNDLTQKKIVVVGLGESGVAAAELAILRGAVVVANDSNGIDNLSPEAQALVQKGVRISSGPADAALFQGTDLVVVSPGVPPLPILEQVRARGVSVIGELEFAARHLGTPIVAIGGTNGKSTTTALVHEMLTAQGTKAFVGANFGTPLSRAVGKSYDVLVLEVSSFQMERAPTFHPRVAALLNVTEDHLDRYATFADYAAAKGNMFVNQTDDDVAVIPKGDSLVTREAHRGDARVVTFGPGGDVMVDEKGAQVIDRLRDNRFPLADIRLSGAHNLANVCAAVACASEAGAGPQAIREALAKFEGLAHRTAFVSEVGGVRYYDDSKGTNVGATVSALRGLPEPRVVLIAGGRDKRGGYGPLAEVLSQKGRAAVLIGEAAPAIAEAVAGKVETVHAASMDEAVVRAAALAQEGDAVLLSPACSSFDMFKDYKDRGDAFVRAVHALSPKRTPAKGKKR